MTTAEKKMKTGNHMKLENVYRKKNKLSLLSVALLLLLLPAVLPAQDLPSRPAGHVNDFADMLTGAEQQQLENKLRNYRDTTTTVVAVATLESLQGYPIEETATRLFNEWNMWEGDQDNGVLILISKADRQMRIEVGYGLEGAIPDVMAGRIIREILTPNFRRGDFYSGLDEATSAIIQLASGEYTGQLTQESSAEDDDIASFIIFVMFIVFVVYAASRDGGRNNGRGKKRRTLGSSGFIWLGTGGFGSGRSSGGSFGGGGGFGGFSGGGGFGSGGGGASGGW